MKNAILMRKNRYTFFNEIEINESKIINIYKELTEELK